MEIKLNDVYKFFYKQEYFKIQNVQNAYHCFDGKLIVKENTDGELYLEDTY